MTLLLEEFGDGFPNEHGDARQLNPRNNNLN